MCSPLGKMLCEVVFLCNKLLNPENTITFSGENARPKVRMKKYEGGDLLEQTEELKWSLFKVLQAQPTSGDKIDMLSNEAEWKQSFRDRNDFGEASPGGVAHEAGSLRMQVTTAVGVVTSPGLVDENCLYLGLPGDNVYVCDLSVFPTTSAANPSLTVVAVAIRLANHLREKLSEPTE